MEKILSEVGSDPTYHSQMKVRVTKLVVGDVEIKRGARDMNWKERNIDHYRILDDPWFMLTTRSRELPPGETVTEFIVHESQPQRCLTVYSGIDMVQ